MALYHRRRSGCEPDAIGRILAQVAEGQQRMEENRAEAEQDSIGDFNCQVTSGNDRAMKPGDLGSYGTGRLGKAEIFEGCRN